MADEAMIREILGYIRPIDRVNNSVVCRTWAEEISSPNLLEDVFLIICGIEMESVLPTLLRSARRYRNIRIIGAILTEDTSALWTKLGGQLRQLELIECFLTTDHLSAILRQCPMLESLTLTGYSEGSAGYANLGTLDDRRLEQFRISLLYVRHFRTDFPLGGELLDQLLTIMPNATSISLNFDPPQAYRPLQLISNLLEATRVFTKLDIGAVELSDEDFLKLVQTHSGTLEHLKVDCTNLTGEALAALNQCTKLRYLSLDGAVQFGDTHLRNVVQSVPDLETLDVSNSDSLTDAGIATIRDLKKLQHLSLFWCLRITSNAVRELRRLPDLQQLDLRGTTVDFKDFKTIGRLHELKTLVLNTGVDSKMFDIICRNLGKLTKLQLGGCERLTDRDGIKLSSLKNLECLSLLCCFGITDLTIVGGLMSLNLRCLTLDGSPLTDTGLGSIAAHQPRLRTLELFNCGNITDGGSTALLRSEPCLETLSLRSCESLTSRTLRVLESTCPRLEWLEIGECHVSTRAVEGFKKRRPFVCVESGL